MKTPHIADVARHRAGRPSPAIFPIGVTTTTAWPEAGLGREVDAGRPQRAVNRGAASLEVSTSMPSPSPHGALPRPLALLGLWPATCSFVQSFMNETLRSDLAEVLAAR